jgi:hypothetical protein
LEKDQKKAKYEIKKHFSALIGTPKAVDYLKQIISSDKELIERVEDISSFFSGAKDAKPSRQSAIANAAGFLLYFESSYIGCVDKVCYLLILNGHDLYDFFGRKYASTPEEIGNIDTITKFKFLEKHGFGSIVRESDRELRNKIAHCDFSLLDGGMVGIKGKSLSISLSYQNLCEFTSVVENTITEVLAEVREEMERETKKNA